MFQFMSTAKKYVQFPFRPEKAFGQVFSSMRKAKGISQEQVALEAGCDRTTVSLIERGLVSPKLNTIVKMCRIIDVRPSELLRRMEQSRLYRG